MIPQLVRIDGGISYQGVTLGDLKVLLIYFEFFAILHFMTYFVTGWTILRAIYVRT